MSSDSVAQIAATNNYVSKRVKRKRPQFWPVMTEFTGFECEKFLTGWHCEEISVKPIKRNFFTGVPE